MRKQGSRETASPLLFKMLKKILVIVFILALIGTGYADDQMADIPIGDSPAMGPVDAPVTIIEFIDFQ